MFHAIRPVVSIFQVAFDLLSCMIVPLRRCHVVVPELDVMLLLGYLGVESGEHLVEVLLGQDTPVASERVPLLDQLLQSLQRVLVYYGFA